MTEQERESARRSRLILTPEGEPLSISPIRWKDTPPLWEPRDFSPQARFLPERTEIAGVPCERCEELTEDIIPMYPTDHSAYWLCPSCANLQQGIAARAKAMQVI